MVETHPKMLMALAFIIFVTSVLSGCSTCQPKVNLKAGHAQVEGLQGKPLYGQMPVVKLNNNIVLSKTIQLPSGQQKIVVKHYRNSARPIVQNLRFSVKAGYCYQLNYQQGMYQIQTLGLCNQCD